MGKELRALRGKFCPLCSQKLNVALHQFHPIGLLEESPKCFSGINFSFTIAMLTKVAYKICLNGEFFILGQI